jgi:glycosyltransferase involved in cell wall biosynthesis
LTNSGTICAVPNPLEDNEIPEGYDVDSFAALIEAISLEIFPEAPTGVGFCMLITRRALDAVGEFDAEVFGHGYGEENDFCQRAIQAGFVNLIADNTFVYHKGRASFGDRSAGMVERTLRTMAARHPRYHADVARFCRDHPLRPFHAYLRESIAARRGTRGTISTRVLHVLHEGGGTEKHARDLAAIDDQSISSYVLISDGRRLDVDEYHAGRRLRSLRFPLPREIAKYGAHPNPAYRDALAIICWTLDIDLVHVHHLIHNTVDIADVAATRGIPYVMTLHDYYAVCPSYTLLDPDGQPCGACTRDADAMASAPCMIHVGLPPSHLSTHQERMSAFLRVAARLFVPNVRVREIIAARFPELLEAMAVIEHGHPRADGGGEKNPRPLLRDSRVALNVAVIGGLDTHKGASVLRDLLRANRREETTFHLYGTTPDVEIMRARHNDLQRLDGSRFVYHGAYDSRDIVGMLRADGIHVGLHLAVWPETFSYTLSEFVEAGVPVIAGSLGAPGERIERCRLGWTVPDVRDPRSTLAILDEIIRNPAMLDDVAGGMKRDEALIPMETMWRRYGEIYGEITAPRRSSMTSTSEGRREAAPSKGYVAFLAMRLAESGTTDSQRTAPALEAQLEWMRERMNSPRHRIAEALGNALQKIPVVWPIVASVTEAVLRWERRRRRRR